GSQLKPRIQMLVNPKTSCQLLWKYALIVPLLAILVGLTAARERLIETLADQPGKPITVSGQVVNEANEPVRATVVLAGDTHGTETDASGHFRLTSVPSSTKLAVSSVGFETQIVLIKGSKPATVMLKRAPNILDEVVAVASGGNQVPTPIKKGENNFMIVEKNPEFPGGMGAL